MIGSLRRGDIRWFRFERPDKRRPVLVLGRDELLESWSQVPVNPLSSQFRGLAWEVVITPDEGVPTACVLKPEWIRAVERTGLGPLAGRLPPARWPDVERAVQLALGFA